MLISSPKCRRLITRTATLAADRQTDRLEHNEEKETGKQTRSETNKQKIDRQRCRLTVKQAHKQTKQFADRQERRQRDDQTEKQPQHIETSLQKETDRLTKSEAKKMTN